jgi:transketolase
MRTSFINAILNEVPRREDLFIITGDAGYGVLDNFQREWPGRYLNLGIAEQNTAGFAAGMALGGYRVLVYNIIPFVLYRCYEQIRNDICYQRLPVILAGIGSGVSYAPAGMTHYSVEDLGIARTLPNLEVFSPCDPVEARLSAKAALESTQPVYIRLAKRGEPLLHSADAEFDVRLPQIMKEGERVAVLFHGSIGDGVMAAASVLKERGIHPLIVSIPRVQPIDLDCIHQRLQGIRRVLCVEEHFDDSGLGASLARALAGSRHNLELNCLGIPPHFLHEIRSPAGMRASFGMSPESIAKRVQQLWEIPGN